MLEQIISLYQGYHPWSLLALSAFGIINLGLYLWVFWSFLKEYSKFVGVVVGFHIILGVIFLFI